VRTKTSKTYSVWNFHSNGRNLLFYLFITRVLKLTVVIVAGDLCYQLHTVLSSILFPRLTPYVDEIIEDAKCGFKSNGSNTNQISCIHQIL
jgi:hypothetical protein